MHNITVLLHRVGKGKGNMWEKGEKVSSRISQTVFQIFSKENTKSNENHI